MITIDDVKSLLFSHFLNASSFSLANIKDIAAIKFEPKQLEGLPQTDEFKTGLIRAGLDEFVKMDILVQVGGSGVYILKHPIDVMVQTVDIPPQIAEMIADIVNGFGQGVAEARENGDDDDESEDFDEQYKCDNLHITERDIALICNICHVLLNSNEKE